MSGFLPITIFRDVEYELAFSPNMTIDWNKGSTQSVILTGNTQITLTGFTNGRPYRLFITQDSSGNRLATFTNTMKWPSGVVPILSKTGDKTDIFTIIPSRNVLYADCARTFC